MDEPTPLVPAWAFYVLLTALFVGLLWFFGPIVTYARTHATPSHPSEMTFWTGIGTERDVFPSLDDVASRTLTVVVPAYNEEERIRSMLDDTLVVLRSLESERGKKRGGGGGAGFSWEVVVVDDGSSDGTSKVVEEYVEREGSDLVRLCKLFQNHGKGGAVRKGMLRARGEYLLMADADGATAAHEIARILDHIRVVERRGHGIVVGSRANSEDGAGKASRTPLRTFLMQGFHLFLSLTLGTHIQDTQCGFKLFTRATARLIFPVQHIERWAFDTELLYLAAQHRVPMHELHVEWNEIEGSKIEIVSATLQMVRDICLIRLCYSTGLWSHTLLAPNPAPLSPFLQCEACARDSCGGMNVKLRFLCPAWWIFLTLSVSVSFFPRVLPSFVARMGSARGYWARRRAREIAKKEPWFLARMAVFELLHFGAASETWGNVWRGVLVSTVVASLGMLASETTAPMHGGVSSFPAKASIPGRHAGSWAVWEPVLAGALAMECVVTLLLLVEFSARLWACVISFDTRFEVSRNHVWHAQALDLKRRCLCYDLRWWLVVRWPQTWGWVAPVTLQQLRNPRSSLVVTSTQAKALITEELLHSTSTSTSTTSTTSSSFLPTSLLPTSTSTTAPMLVGAKPDSNGRRPSAVLSAVNPLAASSDRSFVVARASARLGGRLPRQDSEVFEERIAAAMKSLPRGKAVAPQPPIPTLKSMRALAAWDGADFRRMSTTAAQRAPAPLLGKKPGNGASGGSGVGSGGDVESDVGRSKSAGGTESRAEGESVPNPLPRKRSHRPSQLVRSASAMRLREIAKMAVVDSRVKDKRTDWDTTLTLADMGPLPKSLVKQQSRRMLVRRRMDEDVAVTWRTMERNTRATAAAAMRTQVFSELLRQGAIAAVDNPEQATANPKIKTRDVDAMRRASADASRVLVPVYRDMLPAGPFWCRFWFTLQPHSLFDIFIILPLFLFLFSFIPTGVPSLPLFGFSRPANVLRIVRGFRVLKILRYTPGAPTLASALGHKASDLTTSALMCCILATLLAGAIFIAEQTEAHRGESSAAFDSIPGALYFSFISLSTVGYGDVVPSTGAGKLLAGIGAIIGIGIFSLPSSILAAGFAASSEAILESRRIASRKLRLALARVQLRRGFQRWKDESAKMAFIDRASKPGSASSVQRRRRQLAEQLVQLCGNNVGVVLTTVATAKSLLTEGGLMEASG